MALGGFEALLGPAQRGDFQHRCVMVPILLFARGASNKCTLNNYHSRRMTARHRGDHCSRPIRIISSRLPTVLERDASAHTHTAAHPYDNLKTEGHTIHSGTACSGTHRYRSLSKRGCCSSGRCSCTAGGTHNTGSATAARAAVLTAAVAAAAGAAARLCKACSSNP